MSFSAWNLRRFTRPPFLTTLRRDAKAAWRKFLKDLLDWYELEA